MGTQLIHRRFQELLPSLQGRVLDVGCGQQSYRKLLTRSSQYTGLDVESGPTVDIVVAPDKSWPLPDEYFDVVLCSQMLEFAIDPDLSLHEMNRVLKRGGTVVLAFPFLYNEHRAPFDLQRFTVYRAETMFPGYHVQIERQGAIGSTVAILLLNWVELSFNRKWPTRVLKALLLPVWMAVSLIVNLAGLLVDAIDRTGAFYSNVLVIARKP